MDLRPWFPGTVPSHDGTESAGKEAVVMRADVGDELVVRGRHVGDEDRKGVVVEVHGDHGGPPYLIRWEDGHQSVFFPSADTLAGHHPVHKSR
jgi:Domain of unknown function (DUF1918)